MRFYHEGKNTISIYNVDFLKRGKHVFELLLYIFF